MYKQRYPDSTSDDNNFSDNTSSTIAWTPAENFRVFRTETACDVIIFANSRGVHLPQVAPPPCAYA